MNVDLLIKENRELSEEKQRYKEMWFTTNNSLAKYRKLEQELGCPLEVVERALMNGIYTNVYNGLCIVSRIKDELTVSFDYGVNIKDYKKTWWLKEDKSE